MEKLNYETVCIGDYCKDCLWLDDSDNVRQVCESEENDCYGTINQYTVDHCNMLGCRIIIKFSHNV